MTRISLEVIMHHLQVDPDCHLVRQKRRKFTPKRNQVIYKEVEKLLNNGLIREVHYLD